MALDTRLEEARKLMGDQLKAHRKGKGYSVEYLEEKTGIDRTTIYGIERGSINFTIDKFAALLNECGLSLHDFLVGLKTDGYSEEDREDHRKLQVILASPLKDHITGIRLNLRAIQELVERTLNPRSDAPADRQTKGNLARHEKKSRSRVLG